MIIATVVGRAYTALNQPTGGLAISGSSHVDLDVDRSGSYVRLKVDDDRAYHLTAADARRLAQRLLEHAEAS